jgi:hypothetical protein
MPFFQGMLLAIGIMTPFLALIVLIVYIAQF